MKKILLAVCTLVMAFTLAGCSFPVSELSNIRDLIMEGGEPQTTEPSSTEQEAPPAEPAPEETAPAEDTSAPGEETTPPAEAVSEGTATDETLKEAADALKPEADSTDEEENGSAADEAADPSGTDEMTEPSETDEAGTADTETEPAAATEPDEVQETPEPVVLAELLAEDGLLIREKVKDRFLRYIAVDTTANPDSDTIPSSDGQMMLAREIAAELQEMGVTDAIADDYGYVYASLPANVEGQPVIGLIGHLDTSSAVSGASVRPREEANYDGSDLVLDSARNIVLSAKAYPQLQTLTGDELIITDGTTLLGGDGKAGAAEIVTLCEYLLLHPEITHGTVKIVLMPDREIGRSLEQFDVEAFGADLAYTLDGGVFAEGVQYETFNEAQADIVIQGVDVHPENAKNQMKNAALMAAEFTAMLPLLETPAYTEGDEGFYHVVSMEGTARQATLQIRISDYDSAGFEARKNVLQSITDYLNSIYGADTVKMEINDLSYNMGAVLAEYQEVIDRALEAVKVVGYEAVTTPNRGSTDGAALALEGLPCPNLPTGTANKHGVYECVSVDEMADVVAMLAHLVEGAPDTSAE